MYPIQIIHKKREKSELTKDEIFFFIEQATNHQVSESQIGAFLMASFLNGLSYQETAYFTEAMFKSGFHLTYPKPNKPIVDKHSTGGVGDKTSFLVLPICVASKLAVPMISAKGLGHTGGTLDKLQSIIGFKVDLSQEEINKCMVELGGFIIGQSSEIVPAEALLYKVRDVTSTVDHSSLIASSILSKKLAEKLDFLVVDLKTGEGAFMKTVEKAKELGIHLKGTAEALGLKLKVVLTKMDEPLGRSVGNWLEIEEAEKCLQGDMPKDIQEIVYSLCTEIFINNGIAKNIEQATKMIDDVINNGSALNVFYKLIELQGGDFQASKKLYKNSNYYEIKAKETGFIQSINPLSFGRAGLYLGMSRKLESDKIDYGAGFVFEKKCGDFVQEGDVIYKIYSTNIDKKNLAENFLKNAIVIGQEKIEKKNMILEIL